MLTRQAIVSAARGYIGTPWVHQGRQKDLGLDCIGLITRSLLDAGYVPRNAETFHQHDYPRIGDDETLLEAIANEAAPVEFDDLLPADAILFRWPRHTYPQHCALVTERGDGGMLIVHSWINSRVVVEHHLDAMWRARIVSCWRFLDFNG